MILYKPTSPNITPKMIAINFIVPSGFAIKIAPSIANIIMEKRNKVLMVSKTMSQKRAEDLERITSKYGTMLRMNRSIQAEGSFADVKQDMNFRRYLYRGKANALAESILLAMGRNINKLHCMIQTGRTGTHLFSLKKA